MSVYQWPGMCRDGTASRDPRQCMQCGIPHAPARRHAVLRRMPPATSGEVCDAWSHLWPATHVGRALLRRDLRDLGAVSDAGVWRLP